MKQLVPVVYKIRLILAILMVPTLLLSCWKTNLSKYHIYIWILCYLSFTTLPGDTSNSFKYFFSANLIMHFLAFSWHFWANSIAILGALVFQSVIQPMIVYDFNLDSETYKVERPQAVQLLSFGIRYVFINIIVIHCLISVTGYLYVEAEIPRIGNEKLLN